jgi:hypothetical protein
MNIDLVDLILEGSSYTIIFTGVTWYFVREYRLREFLTNYQDLRLLIAISGLTAIGWSMITMGAVLLCWF